jgi:hypothetical protein
MFKTLISLVLASSFLVSCHKDKVTRRLETKNNEVWRLNKYTVALGANGVQVDHTDLIPAFELTFIYQKNTGIFNSNGEAMIGKLYLPEGKVDLLYGTWNPAFHFLEMKKYGGEDQLLVTPITTVIVGSNNKSEGKPLMLRIIQGVYLDVEDPSSGSEITSISYDGGFGTYYRELKINSIKRKELILEYGPDNIRTTSWDTSDVVGRHEFYHFELIKKNKN